MAKTRVMAVPTARAVSEVARAAADGLGAHRETSSNGDTTIY